VVNLRGACAGNDLEGERSSPCAGYVSNEEIQLLVDLPFDTLDGLDATASQPTS
jgi:hypothetical protein